MPGLIIDERFCMGCHACEVACKQEHGLPEGPRLIRVDLATEAAPPGILPTMAGGGTGFDADAGSRPGTTGSLWRVSVCRHCDVPDCVEACPEGALEQHDGGVRVSDDACTGCRVCADVCPYDAPQFHPESGVMLLCDLCPARTATLGRPACVHHCPALALSL